MSWYLVKVFDCVQGAGRMAIVFKTDSMGEAQLLVALVGRGSADLLVHRVNSRGFAHGDGLWFFSPDRGTADTLIFITSPGMAQLKVCFVDTQGEAGWQGARPHGVHIG